MHTEQQAKKEILASDWSVKGVKFMKGHDADSMECSLYYKGKRVATVWDDSWGGGFQYTPVKGQQKTVELFHKFAHQFTVPSEYFDKGMTYNMDIVVDILVNHFEEEKQIKRWCKTKTIFTLKGDEKGSYRSFNNKFNDKLFDHITNKYGDQLGEILNMRYV